MNADTRQINRINNFDIIRLVAALQVVYRHSQHHFELGGWYEKIGTYFLNYFPGVPIFFTISGFLIFWSFDRNSDNLKKYFRNRFLRLFPALWFCLLLTVFLLLLDAPSISSITSSKSFWLWLAGQISVLQFWTPENLRFWGVGTPNGSLWTIIIEIQFYLLVPFIYFIINKKFQNLFVILMFVLSLTANIYFGSFDEENIIYKVGAVSILPYLYNFLFGVLAYVYWQKISKIVEGKSLFWFSLYVVYIIIFGNILGINLNSYYLYSPLQFLSNVILCFVVLSAAFSYNSFSNRVLNHNDISYGVYIFHMLVINFFVERDLIGKPVYMLLTFLITIAIAIFSWKFVEKPALKLK